MVKKLVEFYEIEAKFSIRKDYWDADNEKISPKIISEKIQSGIEVPIEKEIEVHIYD